MRTNHRASRAAVRSAALAGIAALATLGIAGPTHAAGPPSGFVIDTQFVEGDSDVTGWGAFASCTSATSISNDPVPRTPAQPLFSGLKILHCADGATVTVEFSAFITFPAPGARGGAFKTFGNWSVVESTLAGVTSGGGKLMGDSRTCEVEAGSDGCITDSFRGFAA